MESLLGGSREDCAESKVQVPMRGSAAPGWAATKASNAKLRISPAEPIESSITVADADFRVGKRREGGYLRMFKATINRFRVGHLFESLKSSVPAENDCDNLV